MPGTSRLADLYSRRDDAAADLLRLGYLAPAWEPIWTRLPYDPHLQHLLHVDADSRYPVTHFLQMLDDDQQWGWLLAELSPKIALPPDAAIRARTIAAELQAFDRELCVEELSSISRLLSAHDADMDPHCLGAAEDAAEAMLIRVIGDVGLTELEGDGLVFFGCLATHAALVNANPKVPLVEWPKSKSVSVRERTEVLQMQLFAMIESHDLTYRLIGYDSFIADLSFSQLAAKAPQLKVLDLMADAVKLALVDAGNEAYVDEVIDGLSAKERALFAADPDSLAWYRLAELAEHHGRPTDRCLTLPNDISEQVPSAERSVLLDLVEILRRADDRIILSEADVRRYAVMVNAATEYYVNQQDLRSGRMSRADLGRPQPAEILETRDDGVANTVLRPGGPSGMETL